MTLQTRNRPFLKWAGNKYQCLDNILASFPTANRLIEPFGGSAALFLNTHYLRYWVADFNPDLISLFHHLQQEGIAFINYCQLLFTPENNDTLRYYKLRDEFNQCIDKRHRAALFLYLNRHGYNGLCRYNQTGGYNVPFGRYKVPYFPREEMHYFYKKSHQAHFIQADFETTFLEAQPGDLIYCDPPYVPLSHSASFSSYTSKQFTEQAQIKLADLAMATAARGITVIISNHDTPFTRHHYQNSHITSFPVRRLISCHAKNRTNAQELLAVFTQ